jgi:hypothetical protein
MHERFSNSISNKKKTHYYFESVVLASKLNVDFSLVNILFENWEARRCGGLFFEYNYLCHLFIYLFMWETKTFGRSWIRVLSQSDDMTLDGHSEFGLDEQL